MTTDTAGAMWHPSENYGDRRGVSAPDAIVLHYTAMRSAQEAVQRLCDPAFEVSAHYVIAEDGRLWQLVREADRAWHAGAGAWGSVRDVNSHSIGIELASTALHPFPEPQMAVLEHVLRGALERWDILPQRVVGHSDTAPGRKVDPGARFDWRRLALQGLAVWPEPSRPADFVTDARRFGYDVAGAGLDAVLASFRLRFRPWASGPLDEKDCALMAGLAARWPCVS